MQGFTVLFLFLISFNIQAQNFEIDNQLLAKITAIDGQLYYDTISGNNDSITHFKKGILRKYNPISLTLSGLMYLYQNSISPQLISHCQYELTCSNFSKKAIYEYGLIKGVFLTADRLMRDNSSSISDYKYFNISPNLRGIDHVENYRVK